jgi:16S rRNA processing protein RimM
VEDSRVFKNRWVLHFEGMTNRNDSEALNGIELYGELDDPEDMAQEDAWYPRDLIGLEARLSEGNGLGLPSGQIVGKVVDVIDGPAQSLLKLRLPSPVAVDESDNAETTALVPFVDVMVPQIDLDAGYLTIDPPGGLIPGLQ